MRAGLLAPWLATLLAPLLLLAACLDQGATPALGLIVPSDRVLHANDEDHYTIQVVLPPDTDPGQKLVVTTSLGAVNVAAGTGDSARQTAEIYTNDPDSGEPLDFTLYAGWEPGTGELRVEAPDTGLTGAVATFEILPLDDDLTLEVTPPEPVAGSQAQLTVTLRSQGMRARDIAVTASHGSLPVASIKLSPGQSATIPWLVGTEPAGAATLMATIAPTGVMSSKVVEIVPSSDEVQLEVMPGVYLADGNTLVPITVTRASALTSRATITLGTTHGVLDPGASGEGKKQRTIGLRGGESAQVFLQAGREPGIVLLTASLPEQPAWSTTFVLQHAPPTLLGMSLGSTPVLDADQRQLDISVLFARSPGQGQPSLGTRIYFTPCCDPGAGLEDCAEFLSIPPFATATSTAVDQVDLTLRLTAAGEAFVGQPGDSPADDLPVRVHAYAFDSDRAEATLSCAALGSDVPAGAAATAHADMALRKAPPPPPEPAR